MTRNTRPRVVIHEAETSVRSVPSTQHQKLWRSFQTVPLRRSSELNPSPPLLALIMHRRKKIPLRRSGVSSPTSPCSSAQFSTLPSNITNSSAAADVSLLTRRATAISKSFIYFSSAFFWLRRFQSLTGQHSTDCLAMYDFWNKSCRFSNNYSCAIDVPVGFCVTISCFTRVTSSHGANTSGAARKKHGRRHGSRNCHPPQRSSCTNKIGVE